MHNAKALLLTSIPPVSGLIAHLLSSNIRFLSDQKFLITSITTSALNCTAYIAIA